MKKSRFTEEQIAFALKQAETGTSTAKVLRRMGISEQTCLRGFLHSLGIHPLAGLQPCRLIRAVWPAACDAIAPPDFSPAGTAARGFLVVRAR